MTCSLLKSPVAHHVLSKLSHFRKLLLSDGLVGRFTFGLDSSLHLGASLDVGGISVHLESEGLFSCGLGLEGLLDVMLEWGIEWVVHTFALLTLLVWVGVSGLITLIAVESWVRLEVNVSLGTGQLEVSILGWDDPLSIVILIWVPLVAKGLLNRLGVGLGGFDVVINSEIGNWVIHWVSFKLWVLVLGTSSRGADWVTLHLNISRDSNCLLFSWFLS